MSSSSPSSAPWRAGLEGARANLLPGFVLQAFALSLVLGYYFAPGFATALEGFTAVRERFGVLSSMVTTGLFGGFIPWVYLKLTPSTRTRYDTAQGIALTVFWAIKGVEVHAVYAGLAGLVGTEPTVGTVVIKSLLDQLVYCPLLAVPTMWIGYQWIEHHFDFAPVAARIRPRGWYVRELLPILLANFGVWAPTVAIIYVLPTALQLPLQNIVLCFFTLMMAHLARRQSSITPTGPL